MLKACERLCLLILVSWVLAIGCSVHRVPTKAEADRFEIIAAKIEAAEKMNAADCAPNELARAQSRLERAREKATHRYYTDEAVKKLIQKADQAANDLLSKTITCWKQKRK